MIKNKLEKLKFDLPEMASLNMDNVVNRLIKEQQKGEEIIFTHALRTNAKPPVKGAITRGKLRWRGIKMIQHNEIFKYTKWLEQRGEQISPRIIFEGTINHG